MEGHLVHEARLRRAPLETFALLVLLVAGCDAPAASSQCSGTRQARSLIRSSEPQSDAQADTSVGGGSDGCVEDGVVHAAVIQSPDAEPGSTPPMMSFITGKPAPGDEADITRGHYAFYHGNGALNHGGQTADEVHFFGEDADRIIGLDNGFITAPDDPKTPLYWRYQSANGIGLRLQSASYLSFEARDGDLNLETPTGHIQVAAGGATKLIHGGTGTTTNDSSADLVVLTLPVGRIAHLSATVVGGEPGTSRTSYVRDCTALGDNEPVIVRAEAIFNKEAGDEVEWVVEDGAIRLRAHGVPGETRTYHAIVDEVSVGS
ncbi:MAG: hypothetical protein U0271_08755 [Polyangiaceae bacterium]